MLMPRASRRMSRPVQLWRSAAPSAKLHPKPKPSSASQKAAYSVSAMNRVTFQSYAAGHM